MRKTIVTTPDIYEMTWDYSTAIKVTGGSLLFVSGIIGMTPDGKLAPDLLTQADTAFANLEKVMVSAGGTLRDIVKVNVFVGENYRDHMAEMRKIRSRYFTGDFPVSTLVQVAGFANPDYLFEIEAIAALP
ncbi:RidA family protein [Rhizohabitans arisaemae]|uniref:RidA family protein n=1 Tax=Rhizohabitans arisaemae TaxID=2720610 RepID=UPI0024B1EC91|nr:RidA family protein [Rhizohabitans arisaemae]